MVKVISAKTEQRPFYFDFKKNDIVGLSSTMANLDYDPLPDKQLCDVVRTEIICQQLLLEAKLEGDVEDLGPGVSLNFEGHNFSILEATTHINLQGGNSVAEIKGRTFLSPCEPLNVLKQLRESFAKRS